MEVFDNVEESLENEIDGYRDSRNKKHVHNTLLFCFLFPVPRSRIVNIEIKWKKKKNTHRTKQNICNKQTKHQNAVHQ